MRRTLASIAACAALAACFTTGRHSSSAAATAAAGDSPPAAGDSAAAGPTYDGCPVFPPGDPAYNQDRSNAPVAADSDRYLQSLGTNRSWDDDRIEYVNVAHGGPLVPVASKVRWHAMPPQPWSPSFRIEPVADAHSFVLDAATCRLYELYQTTYDGGLSAYSGGSWDLRRPFVPNPPGRSSAVASGISMFAGAVKYRELAAGRIDHALFLIVPYGTLSQWEFVRPASSTDGQPYRGDGSYRLPYGARLRLRADFPEDGAGPQARAIFRALKSYGAIVGDTGCCYKLVYMNDPSGSDAFDDRDLAAVHAIGPSDWQVLALPEVLRVPGH